MMVPQLTIPSRPFGMTAGMFPIQGTINVIQFFLGLANKKLAFRLTVALV